MNNTLDSALERSDSVLKKGACLHIFPATPYIGFMNHNSNSLRMEADRARRKLNRSNTFVVNNNPPAVGEVQQNGLGHYFISSPPNFHDPISDRLG